MGLGFLKLFSGEGNADINVGGSASKKVLETIEIKTTKSVILSDVVDASKNIAQFDNTIKEGELVLIDNVQLSLENEVELRTVKLFTSGAFKNLSVPGVNGFDITNLFNSMFKDYAYKIKGVLLNGNDKIIIKIPVTFENEFESSYNVDDLFIGKVSVLGIYKGTIKINQLGNYNPQIQISAESETKRSIFREKDKTKRSKKESAQHSKSRNKSFVMTSVSAL